MHKMYQMTCQDIEQLQSFYQEVQRRAVEKALDQVFKEIDMKITDEGKRAEVYYKLLQKSLEDFEKQEEEIYGE